MNRCESEDCMDGRVDFVANRCVLLDEVDHRHRSDGRSGGGLEREDGLRHAATPFASLAVLAETFRHSATSPAGKPGVTAPGGWTGGGTSRIALSGRVAGWGGVN